MADCDYDAQALRDLVEAELELSGLLIERARSSGRRQSRKLSAMVYEIGRSLDEDIKRFEHAWLRPAGRCGDHGH